MADIAAKIKSGSSQPKEGSIVMLWGGKANGLYVRSPDLNRGTAVADLEVKLTDRLDDTRYYAGDTVL